MERSKLWYQAFRKDIAKLKDMKFFIACCNIEFLIGKVERLEKENEALKQELAKIKK